MRILSVVLGFFAFLGPASASAQTLNLTPLPVESLARNRAISGVTISPDGRHMAGLISQENQRWPLVAIWDVEHLDQPPVAIPSREMRPRSVAFLGNEHVVFFADQPFTYESTKTFTVQAIVTDLRGSSFSQPFGGGLGTGSTDAERFGVDWGVLQAGTVEDPNRYVIVRSTGSGSEAISVDVRTMRTERLARVADDQNILLADPRDGQLMIKETLESVDGGWRVVRLVRNRATNAWERHDALSYPIRQRYTVTPLGFYDADPNLLYVSTNQQSNFQQIRIYNIATRTWDPEPAFASPEYDIVTVAPDFDVATGAFRGPASYVIAGPAQTEVFVDSFWQQIRRSLERQFPGQQITINRNWNQSRRDAIIVASGPRNPPAYYILLDGTQLRSIGSSAPWINSATLGDTTFVHYSARDGMNIPGFLTLPPGYDRNVNGRIPAVVLPHGGPWARDFLGWDSSGWTQFLATRGYAVLQPQYRGSDGWGLQHWYAGDREWGQKMQDDNDDGARWLVDQGIADSNRLAIFGYSYGGFAAVAASVRQGGPFRCAIAGAPVADLSRLANVWGANRVQRELQGWTVAGMNPIANVDHHAIPILMYHGDRDRQADTVHSREFSRAFRNAGGTVEYHEVRDMWHQLPWWPEWHRESLGYIENWLAGPNCFGAR